MVTQSWVSHWKLLQWKAANGITDKGFEGLLGIVKNMLPEGNKLPSTTYEAKKVVCPLGLDVQKIHACPNDCILYRGDEDDASEDDGSQYLNNNGNCDDEQMEIAQEEVQAEVYEIHAYIN
jgi:hypothetical protein